MKLTTTIRVGLTDTLFATLRSAAKRTGTSIAGLARTGIEKHLARLEARKLRPQREREIATKALAR